MLTLAEAAQFLRLTPDEVATMIESREMPGVRVGGDYRIPAAGLLAWLNGGRAEETTSTSRLLVLPAPSFSFEREKPFTYRWPKNVDEHYREAHVAHVNRDGVKVIKIGFCERVSGGVKRKRGVVFLNNATRR